MYAHQGGWDEFLYAAVPIFVIFALLRLANSRAKRQGLPQPESAENSTNQPEKYSEN